MFFCTTRSDRGPLSCTLNLKLNPAHLNHTLEVLGTYNCLYIVNISPLVISNMD
jgi:hypothetical protein